jgi:hypothetical protein
VEHGLYVIICSGSRIYTTYRETRAEMKTVRTILIVLLTTATLTAATERAVLWSGSWDTACEVNADTGDIYYSFDKPSNANKGMAYDGTYFWSGGSGDDSKIITKFDKTGLVISTFEVPIGVSCEGITYDGENLWYNTYVNPPGEYRAYHINLDGDLIPPDGFDITYYNYNIYDAAWDGEYLWVIAGLAWDCYALCYDVNTAALIESFSVGDDFWQTETRCIASDGTYIYTIGWEKTNPDVPNWIYKYTKTGTEVDHIYTLLTGWQWGLSYWEEGITNVKPASFGEIKAIYK